VFTEFRLRNFRTHKDTRIRLGALTLLIGGNNSGKTNFLAGIREFSKLAARGRPESANTVGGATPEVGRSGAKDEDYLAHVHRLSRPEPLVYSCVWQRHGKRVAYELSLTPHVHTHEAVPAPPIAYCSERIELARHESDAPVVVETGTEGRRSELGLQKRVASEVAHAWPLEARRSADPARDTAALFFENLSRCRYFDLQTRSLQGYGDGNGARPSRRETTAAGEAPSQASITDRLRTDGGGLHAALRQMSETDQEALQRWQAALQRFEPSFRAVKLGGGEGPRWGFDLGGETLHLDDFAPDVVSGGLLRAAAVGLLAEMESPPPLIMLEEIENGISQRNLATFLAWLRQAAGPPQPPHGDYRTQFILTSHSPSVLREFSEYLNDAYFFRLHQYGYRSVVTNLGDSMATYINMGVAEGEVIPAEHEGDRPTVVASPTELTDMWFSGTIGGGVV